MSSKFYVYHLIDPRSGSVFYVGKGFGPRAQSHLIPSGKGSGNPFKAAVISRIRMEGFEPTVHFHRTGMDEVEAFDEEKREIARFGRRDLGMGCLTNLTDGGEGQAGAIFSNDRCRAISAALTGRPLSAETRAKISAARSGMKFSDSHRAAISKAQVGQIRSPLNPATREKISLIHKGNKYCAGRIVSAETRAKISSSKRKSKKVCDEIV